MRNEVLKKWHAPATARGAWHRRGLVIRKYRATSASFDARFVSALWPEPPVNRWVLLTRDKESSRPETRGPDRNHGGSGALFVLGPDSRARSQRAQVVAELAVKAKT